MGRKGTPAQLFIEGWNAQEIDFLRSEANWKVISNDQNKVPGFSYVRQFVLEFQSLKERRMFVRNYCDGHTYGKNTYMARFGHEGIPAGRLRKGVSVNDIEKMIIVCPNINMIECDYPEIYKQLCKLYRHIGIPRNGGILRKGE